MGLAARSSIGNLGSVLAYFLPETRQVAWLGRALGFALSLPISAFFLLQADRPLPALGGYPRQFRALPRGGERSPPLAVTAGDGKVVRAAFAVCSRPLFQ